MDKISPIKKNILYFIDNQGITKKDFCDITGISYGNMKGKGLESEIGGGQLYKILHSYPQINPDWLIMNKGEMLRENSLNIPLTAKEPSEIYGPSAEIINALKEVIAAKEETIQSLKEQLEQYKSPKGKIPADN